MNLFLRRSVRLSLLVAWITQQLLSAAWVKGTRHYPLDNIEGLRCQFPDDGDGAGLALCRRCLSNRPSPPAAAAGERSSVAECCSTAAVQERCQKMTSLLRSSGHENDDGYNFDNRSQWSERSSSKFLLSRRGTFLFGKRPRNTFLGKRGTSVLDTVHGGGNRGDGGDKGSSRQDGSEKRLSRNKFLGKRSDRSSS